MVASSKKNRKSRPAHAFQKKEKMKKKAAPTIIYKDHELVPKHIKLSEKEKKELLENYKITIAELPKILITDPAIAKLHVKPGDVIKIIRKSPTSKESVFYRGVISA